jgi:hypothetical protein
MERSADIPRFPKAESGALETRRLSDGTRELLKGLTVHMSEAVAITVPKGFTTDFSSIPWIFRFIVRWSKVDIAGVVHDWLYYTGEKGQAEADRIWRVIALAGKHRANGLQAWLCWIGLRLGGWWAWCQHRRARERRALESS